MLHPVFFETRFLLLGLSGCRNRLVELADVEGWNRKMRFIGERGVGERVHDGRGHDNDEFLVGVVDVLGLEELTEIGMLAMPGVEPY
jgi:hypothetical protein